MALKLKWKNPNKGATTIDIYRGNTAQVDTTTPLVTLSNGETEWVDTGALFGKTYYYVWAVNTTNDRVVSRPQKIEVSDRRGPGSNLLLQGNESYGYYGAVLAADFINSNTILSALKSLSSIPSTLVYPTWHKFTRNGNILFVPDQGFGDVAWNALYTAGAVYGTNDNGPEGTPQNVNQLCTFELNGDLFKIRVPKGYPDGLTWAGTTDTLNTMPEAAGKYSEYEDLFYPLLQLTPLRKRMVTVAAVNANSVITSRYGTDGSAIGVLCQEVQGNNNLRRGQSPYNYGAATRGTVETCAARGKTQALCWWPIVEYIGRVGEVDLAHL
ncbi:putative virion structural protein [Erwinia phage Derbicus]|uniref:Putative virion structural protein n=2 Tax=Derbicusvirus derbicus TaxID=2734104 RepID=A0A482IDP4_9CAUD|nr:putative virion structural protein [Erwinia phage vB_EamM_EarlPhillipIV]YP_009821193.1 putative virion structural protein [Erwinia phage Derbicus]ANZ48998.1 putative virion structural protein [Erwinia phage vB_EamM_EarlPhillipIV]QBP07575.1 putative virion structural protein [Erwinia phage Derbicus]